MAVNTFGELLQALMNTYVTNNAHIVIGRSEPWLDDATPPANPTKPYTPTELADIQNKAICSKLLSSSSFSFVVPRVEWKLGDSYVQDTFIMNDEFDVYVCISSALLPTTHQPRGKYPKNMNFPDSYIWKYLYTIEGNQRRKFLTQDFMPVPLTETTPIGTPKWIALQTATADLPDLTTDPKLLILFAEFTDENIKNTDFRQVSIVESSSSAIKKDLTTHCILDRRPENKYIPGERVFQIINGINIFATVVEYDEENLLLKLNDFDSSFETDKFILNSNHKGRICKKITSDSIPMINVLHIAYISPINKRDDQLEDIRIIFNEI